MDRTARTFRVRHSRGTVARELPVTRQFAAILDQRHAASENRRTDFVLGCFRRRPVQPAISGSAPSVQEDRQRRRSEIPVPGHAQLVPRGGGARSVAAILADQPVAQSQSDRRHRCRPSRRLDHRAAPGSPHSESPTGSRNCFRRRRRFRAQFGRSRTIRKPALEMTTGFGSLGIRSPRRLLHRDLKARSQRGNVAAVPYPRR